MAFSRRHPPPFTSSSLKIAMRSALPFRARWMPSSLLSRQKVLHNQLVNRQRSADSNELAFPFFVMKTPSKSVNGKVPGELDCATPLNCQHP